MPGYITYDDLELPLFSIDEWVVTPVYAPDDINVIASDVKEMSQRYDFVFTVTP